LDFLQSTDAPYAVKIKGVPYSIPRFLRSALSEWAALKKKEIEDNATRIFVQDATGKPIPGGERAKSQFLLVFQAAPIDVRRLLDEALTTDGSAYVVRRQLKLAGVPDELIEEIIEHDDPALVRNLAEELTMLPATAAKINALAGTQDGADPLQSAPPPQDGALSTGENSNPDSESSTPKTPTPSLSSVT
jgi:hypothetical protein